jgi:uncharacterized protein with von Willebrand factor type A (vWA) domain
MGKKAQCFQIKRQHNLPQKAGNNSNTVVPKFYPTYYNPYYSGYSYGYNYGHSDYYGYYGYYYYGNLGYYGSYFYDYFLEDNYDFVIKQTLLSLNENCLLHLADATDNQIYIDTFVDELWNNPKHQVYHELSDGLYCIFKSFVDITQHQLSKSYTEMVHQNQITKYSLGYLRDKLVQAFKELDYEIFQKYELKKIFCYKISNHLLSTLFMLLFKPYVTFNKSFKFEPFRLYCTQVMQYINSLPPDKRQEYLLKEKPSILSAYVLLKDFYEFINKHFAKEFCTGKFGNSGELALALTEQFISWASDLFNENTNTDLDFEEAQDQSSNNENSNNSNENQSSNSGENQNLARDSKNQFRESQADQTRTNRKNSRPQSKYENKSKKIKDKLENVRSLLQEAKSELEKSKNNNSVSKQLSSYLQNYFNNKLKPGDLLESAGLSEYLKQSIQDRLEHNVGKNLENILNLYKMIKDFQENVGKTVGTEISNGLYLTDIMQNIHNSIRLDELVKSIGQLKKVQSKKRYSLIAQDDLKYILSGDLSRLASSELTYLDDDLIYLFYRKWLEKNLLCYTDIPHKKEEGDVIIFVDESGSMSGPHITHAYSLVYYLAQELWKKNRKIYLVKFSSDYTCHFKLNGNDRLKELLKLLSTFKAGGTTISYPLYAMLYYLLDLRLGSQKKKQVERLNKAISTISDCFSPPKLSTDTNKLSSDHPYQILKTEYRCGTNVDIVIITDGYTDISRFNENALKDLCDIKKDLEVNIYGLFVTSQTDWVRLNKNELRRRLKSSIGALYYCCDEVVTLLSTVEGLQLLSNEKNEDILDLVLKDKHHAAL